MSRKDEIIKAFIKHEVGLTKNSGLKVAGLCECKYEIAATDIEKLFEVEGRVEYVVQWYSDWSKKWKDCNDAALAIKDGKELLRRWGRTSSEEYRLIKRTTTDEIIE